MSNAEIQDTVISRIFTPEERAKLQFSAVDFAPMCIEYVNLAVLITLQFLDETKLADLQAETPANQIPPQVN